MRRVIPLSLPAVAAVLLLSGCGAPAPTEPRPGGGATTVAPTGPSPTTPATSPTTPTIGPTTGPTGPTGPVIPSTPIAPGPTKPGGPVGSGRPVTVDGVAEAGVEPGCRVLTAGGATYLLLGPDVPLGVPVRVTGILQPGVLTTCQQGTPIRVTKVQRR
jgi:hypothetical protein